MNHGDRVRVIADADGDEVFFGRTGVVDTVQVVEGLTYVTVVIEAEDGSADLGSHGWVFIADELEVI